MHVPESWGNANTWASRAAAMGYTVSNTPVVGSIGQTSRGYYGHVVVVLEVHGNTTTIGEMNYDGAGGVREREASISEFVYIYPK